MSVEKYYETYWSPDGFQPEVEMGSWLRKLLEDNVTEGARCVDVGCGDGNTYAAWLAGRRVDYVGARHLRARGRGGTLARSRRAQDRGCLGAPISRQRLRCCRVRRAPRASVRATTRRLRDAACTEARRHLDRNGSEPRLLATPGGPGDLWQVESPGRRSVRGAAVAGPPHPLLHPRLAPPHARIVRVRSCPGGRSQWHRNGRHPQGGQAVRQEQRLWPVPRCGANGAVHVRDMGSTQSRRNREIEGTMRHAPDSWRGVSASLPHVSPSSRGQHQLKSPATMYRPQV